MDICSYDLRIHCEQLTHLSFSMVFLFFSVHLLISLETGLFFVGINFVLDQSILSLHMSALKGYPINKFWTPLVSRIGTKQMLEQVWSVSLGTVHYLTVSVMQVGSLQIIWPLLSLTVSLAELFCTYSMDVHYPCCSISHINIELSVMTDDNYQSLFLDLATAWPLSAIPILPLPLMCSVIFSCIPSRWLTFYITAFPSPRPHPQILFYLGKWDLDNKMLLRLLTFLKSIDWSFIWMQELCSKGSV